MIYANYIKKMRMKNFVTTFIKEFKTLSARAVTNATDKLQTVTRCITFAEGQLWWCHIQVFSAYMMDLRM